MNKEETQTQAIISFSEQSNRTLYTFIEDALQKYLDQLGDAATTNIYDMLLSEMEEPLLKTIMNHVHHNQSKAAVLLGLSRGTLRTKLARYGMLTK